MTTGGGLNGAASTVTDHCRAFAISPDLGNGPVGQRMYYGLRRPLPDATGNYKVFYARDFQGLWHDWTPTVIKNGSFNLTDIVIDDKDPTRVFISMGMVHWSMGPIASERVFRGDYDPIGNNMVWTDMSAGLTQLPVTCLAYQAGSDDIIYAGTDAGVYRYDKPLNCWVKFNGSSGGNPMPSVVVHDLVIDYCAGKIVMGSYSRGLWETDLYQLNQFPGPSTKIVSNETWGSTNPAIITNKIVKGSIVITSGNTLTIVGTNNTGNQNATSSNTTIYMPKWGQILIEKGGKLVVNGAHITNECDATWSGIFAYGHGAVPQTISPLNGLDPNHGWVLLDHAIISNAEEALNNGGGNNAPWPNTGGIIQVSKSHFINNHRSAAFYKYRNLIGAVLNADMSFIVGSRFDVDDNIRIPFYSHISNWGTSGIKIDQNEFNNTQNSTVDHRDAIISIDAGYQFKYNTVNGFKNGLDASIFSYSYENLFPVNIVGNIFDKDQIGIHLRNLSLPVIVGNLFQIGMRQDAGSGSYYSLGAKMENTSSFAYIYNSHKNDYGDPVSVYTAGTEVHNTGQNDENITQNYYQDLWIGNDGDYTCAFITNDIYGLKYTCNDNIDNVFFDFIFQANPYIRKYQNGSAMNIGAANTFTQSGTMASWHQVTGGNGPINYVYNQNVASEIPNGNSFNYTPITKNTSECSNQFAFNIAKLDSCKSDELDATELEYLKLQYYSNDSAYNIFSTLHAQFLDNGNTEELVEEVQNATAAEQLTIRADFLSISPYVSSDVLRELGMQEVVSNPIYLEILLANPDATNTENFMDFLTGELPNPLPEYMIEMIRASWTDAQTPRNLLEQNMSNYHNRMTVLKNHIIRTYIVNSELANLDSAYEWKKLVPSIRNSYEIIEQNLYNGNVTVADSLLENISSQFRFANRDEIEHEAFILLYNFKKSIIEDSIEIDELDSTKINILKGIADAEEYTFPRSMARNVLCYFYQICYPDSVRELPSLSGKPIKNRPLKPQAEHVLVYPNPAKDFVVCYYDLSAKLNEASEILISDMTGKQVYRARLNGSIGQHIWDTRNIDLGNYIYTITTKSGEKYSGKILIQR